MSKQPYLFTETNKDLVTTVKLKSMNEKIKDSVVCTMGGRMNNLNGNWHAGHLGEGKFREEVVFDCNSGLVCNVIDSGERGQSKANLIAAAPELLTALEWALENLDDDLDLDFQAAKTQCEMLVKKAKGEV